MEVNRFHSIIRSMGEVTQTFIMLVSDSVVDLYLLDDILLVQFFPVVVIVDLIILGSRIL